MPVTRAAIGLGLAVRVLATIALAAAPAASGAAKTPSGIDLIPLSHPRALPPLHFMNAHGDPVSIADFRGKLVLLNIWATWCPACRGEIGALGRLERLLGGPKFQVLAIALDQGGAPVVKRFLAERRIHGLEVFLDPSTTLAEELGVYVLPTSFVIDARGREIAKVIGSAAWDRPQVIGWFRRAAGLEGHARAPSDVHDGVL